MPFLLIFASYLRATIREAHLFTSRSSSFSRSFTRVSFFYIFICASRDYFVPLHQISEQWKKIVGIGKNTEEHGAASASIT